jgi:hypothetical protein
MTKVEEYRARASECELRVHEVHDLEVRQLFLRPRDSLALGAIIERVRTGTPARWAPNHEIPLALLECGGYDSRGAALNARRRWWLE